MAAREFHILLVEDNPGDARLTLEALKEARAAARVSHVTDGTDALDFLRRTGAFHGVTRPDLILLDLNLPRKDGREVLAEIKSDECLRHIPVVVLTTSRAEADISRAYDLRANCYVQKPVEFLSFQRVVHCIDRFWFATARVPID